MSSSARDLGEFSLDNLGDDKGGQGVSEGCGIDAPLEGAEGAVLFELGEPGLHGVARQPDLVGEGDGGCSRVVLQGEKQACVGGVDQVVVGHDAGLVIVFSVATAMALIAELASVLRGSRYFHTTISVPSPTQKGS
jgi:hypothetical protein